MFLHGISDQVGGRRSNEESFRVKSQRGEGKCAGTYFVD